MVAKPTVQTYHVSKVLHAPLSFAFKWCTDYREDDPRIIGSKNRRSILEKTKGRVIYTNRYKSGGKTMNAVNIVTLKPPRAWYLDSRGDEDDEIGEYRLTGLGPRRTRLDMTFVEYWKIRNYPGRAEYLSDIHRIWDKYATALEKDYRRHK
ncbi:MAG: hypothetical protein ABSE39_08615 [Candidatus Bathyarchaeia archaeon]|jgi:hypothetical protein